MAKATRTDPGLEPEERAARRLLELTGLTPPVDVNELAVRHADVEEEELPISGDAVVIRAPNHLVRPLILLNRAQKNIKRRRFTIAHEIGHLALGWHSGTFACKVSEEETYVSGDYGVAEKEANNFASELLMPTPWVKLLIERYESLDEIFNGLIDGAQVSPTAARIKLARTLPPGYVCVEYETSTKNIIKIQESIGFGLSLFVEPGDRTSLSRLTRALEANSVDSYTLKRNFASIGWWKLDCRCELPDPEGGIPSAEILRGIIQILYDETRQQENSRIFAVNGFASEANQKTPCRDLESLYGAMRLRFNKEDLQRSPRIGNIIRHPLFSSYLSAKAKEIFRGDSGKSRRRSSGP